MKYYITALLLLMVQIKGMSQNTTISVQCDPETGLCMIPAIDDQEMKDMVWDTDREIIYVGDPMCSWCWGISPQLNALKRYAESQGIPFRMIMGGLRAGGGEEWNTQFQDFLRHHWEEVSRRSGQPFRYTLLSQDHFDYDTQPACRALVTARTLAPEKALSFYEWTQHYFYVQNKDPKELSFYRPICEELQIDYGAFSEAFDTEEMREATRADFMHSAQMGVRGFPTVIYRIDDQLYALARGYAEFADMKEGMAALESRQ